MENLRIGKRQELLRDLCEKSGISYCDLEQHYPDDYGKLFLEDNAHWNKKGHQLIAATVMEVLSEEENSPSQNQQEIAAIN